MWCNTPVEIFFHHSKQFLNSSVLMSFSASAIFCFTSFTSAKCFPLRTFLSSRFGQDQMHKEGGAQNMPVFGQKPLNTRRSVVRCTRKSPIMKWAKALRESSKKIHWSSAWIHWTSLKKFNAASHNNASWYTDIDGFLEHWPSGRSLCYPGPTL